jgi:hypothetical protein
VFVSLLFPWKPQNQSQLVALESKDGNKERQCISLESVQRFANEQRVYTARCAYAANVVGKGLDIFAVGAVSLYHIL